MREMCTKNVIDYAVITIQAATGLLLKLFGSNADYSLL